MQLMWKYIQPLRWWVALSLLLAAVAQVLTLVDPLIFGHIIDEYALNAGSRPQGELLRGALWWLLIAAAVALGARLARTFQDYVLALVVQRFGMQLFNDGLRQTLRLAYQEFEDRSSGETMALLQKVRADTQRFISAAVNIVFSSLVGLVFLFRYAITKHWLLIPVETSGGQPEDGRHRLVQRRRRRLRGAPRPRKRTDGGRDLVQGHAGQSGAVRASRVHAIVAASLLAPAALAQEAIDHEIPPGYEPVAAEDEQGLWLEVEEYEKSVRQSALLVDDPDINNYVNAIVCRVAGDYCPDFRVYVIRNPGFNASMTPNGMMQVWTGLLLRAQTSDEVAAVIGHEIAHYTRLHTLERLRRVKDSMAAGSVFDIGFAVLTGVSAPIGQATAMLSALSFSREQEQEADFLGVRMIAEAAYDPHAAYRIWENLIAEEEAAVVKREEPGLFSRTHPDADERAEELKRRVTARYGPADAELVANHRHLEFLNANYMALMENQIDTNRFGRTQALLERHSAIGVEPALVHYFYGEMFRQRGGADDDNRAMDAYRHAIEDGAPPPAAYKNLGYLYLKAGDTGKAQEHFRRYLELAPDASDRAMIEFYLEDEVT